MAFREEYIQEVRNQSGTGAAGESIGVWNLPINRIPHNDDSILL